MTRLLKLDVEGDFLAAAFDLSHLDLSHASSLTFHMPLGKVRELVNADSQHGEQPKPKTLLERLNDLANVANATFTPDPSSPLSDLEFVPVGVGKCGLTGRKVSFATIDDPFAKQDGPLPDLYDQIANSIFDEFDFAGPQRKTIHKYQMPVAEEFALDLPLDAEIIRVADIGGMFWLWAMVNPEAPTERRYFKAFKTGALIEDADEIIEYLGFCAINVQMELGLYIFEVTGE